MSVITLAPSPWTWKNFTPMEMACKCCKCCPMDPEFMDRLQRLRTQMGRALQINSGYRCPAHNARVSKTGADGPHTTGQAVDIKIYGRDALALMVKAIDLGFTGFGWQQHSSIHTRYVHLDDLPPAPGRPRPWIWSY